jgi:hypothetical protein
MKSGFGIQGSGFRIQETGTGNGKQETGQVGRGVRACEEFLVAQAFRPANRRQMGRPEGLRYGT